jgi:hypothetical protein
MDFFRWEASYELKKQIVDRIFYAYVPFFERHKLEEFLEEYKEQPVSFFTEIKNDIDKSWITDSLTQLRNEDIGSFIHNRNSQKIKTINISKLYEIAQQRLAQRVHASEGGKWQL